MKTKKRALPRWQRIGIVLSIIWALSSAYWTTTLFMEEQASPAIAKYEACLDRGERSVETCRQIFQKDYAEATWLRRLILTLTALALIPLLWIIALGAMRRTTRIDCAIRPF